jgi:hypothetical protein
MNAVRNGIAKYRQFFLHHDDRILLTSVVSGSIGGGLYAYNEFKETSQNEKEKVICTMLGTSAGGLAGAFFWLLLEPVIIPSAVIGSFVYAGSRAKEIMK